MRSRQIAKGSLVPAGLYSVILTNPPAQYRLIKSSSRPSPLTHPPIPRPHSLSSWQPQSQRDRRQEPSFLCRRPKLCQGPRRLFGVAGHGCHGHGGVVNWALRGRLCEMPFRASACAWPALDVSRGGGRRTARALFSFRGNPRLVCCFLFFGKRSTSVILPINSLAPKKKKR